jgi:hypothetical protein
MLSATAIPPPQEQSGVETATLVEASIEALLYFCIHQFACCILTYRLIAAESKTLMSKYGQISRNVSHD